MIVLIGIDDTDNKNSRGTGYRARQLGRIIEDKGLGVIESISRHQLFYDSRIPYTSKNSSACLKISNGKVKELIQISREFLLEVSAVGSDAGLAVAQENSINQAVVNWGKRAKKEVLTQKEAYEIAEESGICLKGLTGDKDGIIGSLAAIGLRKEGNDGRCIWLKGFDIRELKGSYKISEIYDLISVDRITDRMGILINENKNIDIGDWVRPVILNSKITIIADKIENHSDYEYKVSSKDYIKTISD